MNIYFVRHGITAGNDANQFQLPTIELSEKGIEQARFLGRRFETIPVDVVFSSPMTRAMQTARIIAEHTKHEVTPNDLFQEILRPSAVRGRSKDEPEVQAIMKEMKQMFTVSNGHHSDEENFFEARTRAAQALAFLSHRDEKEILVVTHGEILRMMLSVVTFGEEVTFEVYDAMKRTFIPFNTGVTKVQYDMSFGYKKSGWYVLVWNDHAHLGEIKQIPADSGSLSHKSD